MLTFVGAGVSPPPAFNKRITPQKRKECTGKMPVPPRIGFDENYVLNSNKTGHLVAQASSLCEDLVLTEETFSIGNVPLHSASKISRKT